MFVIAVCLLAVASGIFEPTFNNYVDATFHVTASQRGNLELPREFPGFMVAALAGAFFFLGEANLAVIAACLVGLGMFGLAAFANQSHQFAMMVAFMVVWSTGAHLAMPVTQSLALAVSKQRREGAKLGMIGSAASLATIVGAGIVWLNFKVLNLSYSRVFLAGTAAAGLAALTFAAFKLRLRKAPHGKRPRLVFRKRYRLYYVLSVLYGARKQLFITFGPWVLIRIYHQQPQTFALLWIISTAIKVFLLPLVGRLIDEIGEQRVLMADCVLLLAICLAYAFAGDVLPPEAAFVVVCGAYVIDLVLFPVQMARATYLSKIAENRADISGTLGLGVSIDHAVSIPAAILGGYLWQACDNHRPVFLLAAGVALVTFFASSLIRTPAHAESHGAERPAAR